MMKTPVQKGVLLLMVRLLWAIPILWNQSPQYSLNYQICTSTKMEHSWEKFLCPERQMRHPLFYLRFSFPCSNMLSVTWIGENESVRNPKPLQKLSKRIETTHLTVFTYLCLCTFELWPWLAGNLKEYKGTGLSSVNRSKKSQKALRPLYFLEGFVRSSKASCT